jgi:hypothetical protein
MRAARNDGLILGNFVFLAIARAYSKEYETGYNHSFVPRRPIVFSRQWYRRHVD